jgi:hypothetical protein
MSRIRGGRLAAAAACCCAALPATAHAETDAGLQPSFLPDVLGASTAVTLAFGLHVGLEGVPPPTSRIVVHLPAGLGIDLRAVARCAVSRLRSAGAGDCPTRSLIGGGNAVLEVHAGSQSIPEQAVIRVFRGPDRGGRPTVAILSRGDTPLQEQTLSTATLSADHGPYGYRLTVSIPPIPTVTYEPDASIVSLSLTLGTVAGRPRAHAAAGTITVPRHCPVGGFSFAAEFAFADETTAAASARVRCP